MTDNDLRPVSPEELEQHIAIQISAMRARKEAGWIRDNPLFVKALVKRMWLAGIRPYRNPPALPHSAHGGETNQET